MTNEARTPMHLWIAGGISLLWNIFGAYDYVMTQTENAAYLEMFTPEQRAFFNSFPMWMEATWALGVWGAVAGSILLLMRSRLAVWAFIVSLAGLALSTLWQFRLSGADIGTIFGTGPLTMTVLIWAVAIALLIYALRQKNAGVLR